MKTARKATTPLVIGAMLVLAACSGSAQDSDGSSAVTIRLENDIDTLDPQLTDSAEGYFSAEFLYDTLVGLDGKNGVHPLVAASWEVTPKSVEFVLRDDVTCTDGTKVTPSVVKKSLDRLLDPKTAAPNVSFVFGSADAEVVADDATSRLTVSVAEANGDLLSGLAHPASSIICPKGIQSPDSLRNGSAGSGPFEITRVKRGDRYVMKTHTKYAWGMNGNAATDRGFPSGAELRVVTSESTATNLFNSGDLDIVSLSGLERKRASKNKEAKETKHERQTISLLFNQEPGRVAASEDVRRALAMGIDRSAFAMVATKEDGNVGQSFINSTTPCYDESLAEFVPDFDEQGAEQALVDAGWSKDGDGVFAKDGKKLSVDLLVSSGRGPGGDYILAALRKIGVDVKLQDVDFNTYLDLVVGQGDYDLTLLPLTMSNASSPWYAALYFTGDSPPDGTNLGRSDNPAANAAAAKARGTVNKDQRCAAWYDAQKIVLENVDFLPLVRSPRSWFTTRQTFDLTAYGNIYPASLRTK